MKFTKTITLTFLAGAVCAALLASNYGCAMPQVTPGTPAVLASTNAATGIVIVAQAATPPVTNYVPNATVGQIVTVGQAVAPAIPQPWGAVLYALLGVVGAVSTTIAVAKNNKLNSTAGQLVTAQSVHDTIIQGIEATGAAAAAIKQSIAKTALANGNADAVETAVNKITGSQ